MRSLFTLTVLAVSGCASAQTAPLVFDVASVKAAPPAADMHRIMVRMSTDAGRLTYSNVTLRQVLTAAYKVKESQISGPDWMKTERYDISAKFPEGATKEDVPRMLQALLADRFKLKLQRETKSMPVYALLAVKGGAKLKPSDEEQRGFRMMMGPRGHQLSGTSSLANLADTLSNQMDRPVIDMTEMKGNFLIELEWTPEDGQHSGPFGGGASDFHRAEGGDGKHAETADAPSIFTALQDKLGLKLESRKLPVDMISVDSVEKVPTEN